MMLTTRPRRDWLNAILHAPVLSNVVGPMGSPMDWMTHAGIVGGRLRSVGNTTRGMSTGRFGGSRSATGDRYDGADVDEITVLKITYPTAGVERSSGPPGPQRRRPGV